MATVDILERARKYDPEGDRTIGVVTKPDLVDVGTEGDICDTVRNITKPLKLGYVLVKNRSQKELKNKSLQDALASEKSYFQTHPVYSTLPSELLGVNNLTSKLTKILVTRILVHIPDMLNQTETQLKATEASLSAMGEALPEGEQVVPSLMDISNKFITAVDGSIHGRYDMDVLALKPSLRLCALKRKLYLDFQKDINDSKPNFGSTESLQSLFNDLADSKGNELSGFLSTTVFNQRVRQYLTEWKGYAIKLSDLMTNLTKNIFDELSKHFTNGFFKLKAATNNIFEDILETQSNLLKLKIEDAFREEAEIPSTQNHYFNDIIQSIRLDRNKEYLMQILQPLEKTSSASGTTALQISAKQLSDTIAATMSHRKLSNEQFDAEEMDIYLHAYWKVANKRFVDNIPQIIDSQLLENIFHSLKSTVIPKLLDDKNELFEVSSSDKDKRNALEDKVKRLLAAKKLLKEHILLVEK